MISETGEAIMQLLRNRRSVPRVEERRPSRDLVEGVIQAATWAPNHHRNAPWRFVVVAGDARRAMGETMAASLQRIQSDPESPEAESARAKERAKPLRAPVIIVAAAVETGHPKAIQVEDIQAVAAGVENMLVAAQALGLGAMWRTGNPAYDPAVIDFLGLPEGAHIVAFVYLGYPDVPLQPRQDRDAAEVTTWLGWEQQADT